MSAPAVHHVDTWGFVAMPSYHSTWIDWSNWRRGVVGKGGDLMEIKATQCWEHKENHNMMLNIP